MLRSLTLIIAFFMLNNLIAQQKPLNFGVIGLTHTHVHWIFGSEQQRDDIKIVGIVEPNRALAERYSKQYDYPLAQIYDDIETMLDKTQPTAVTAFGTIYDHLKIVETCAPRGIHVMVEKPLEVNLEHAERMAALAKKYDIQLLTNYETTWYPTNHKAYELIKQDSAIGDMRRIIVRDGHRGPKKIGVNAEFLEWLTDPVLNGGGAIIDFGCYGANLATWLMDGKKPNSVTAVTQQLQPENNPKVDDEATIILTYDDLTVLIEASWNWSIGRKDMEIYGLKGVIYADNRHDLRVRMAEGYDGFTEEKFKLEERAAPLDDPFAYLSAVLNGAVQIQPTDLSALENNLVVMEILSAAVESAKTGKTIFLQ
ncbi:MAG: Gfo/Idh/MocA family protein [Saprospiraceae bacterium]